MVSLVRSIISLALDFGLPANFEDWLIVMTFLDLAAQMTHYFCKQLAFFLIVCMRFYLEAHPFQLA